jgi:hypothetical protein
MGMHTIVRSTIAAEIPEEQSWCVDWHHQDIRSHLIHISSVFFQVSLDVSAMALRCVICYFLCRLFQFWVMLMLLLNLVLYIYGAHVSRVRQTNGSDVECVYCCRGRWRRLGYIWTLGWWPASVEVDSKFLTCDRVWKDARKDAA